MLDIGTPVYWSYKNKNGDVIERAGTVFGIVQPEVHPNQLFPNLFSENLQTRTYISYIVNVQDVLFFPAQVEVLPEDKMYLLKKQAPITSKQQPVDRSDRMKLRKMCRDLGYDYDERESYFYILTTKKKLKFRVLHGQEFICDIEEMRI
jgi:hypothetical protein